MTTSRQPSVRLRPLGASDEQQARQAHQELAHEDFQFLVGLQQNEPWPSYLERLQKTRSGAGLPENWVPATFLVAAVDGQIVGRVSVRHELNDFLAAVGGHIGYAVRPGFRRGGSTPRGSTITP